MSGFLFLLATIGAVWLALWVIRSPKMAASRRWPFDIVDDGRKPAGRPGAMTPKWPAQAARPARWRPAHAQPVENDAPSRGRTWPTGSRHGRRPRR